MDNVTGNCTSAKADITVKTVFDGKQSGQQAFMKLIQRQYRVSGADMRERLDGAAREQEDNSKWLSLIRQYADIKELDREMLHLLIKEIVVHEDMAEGKRNTTVEIHFNFMKQGSQLAVKS